MLCFHFPTAAGVFGLFSRISSHFVYSFFVAFWALKGLFSSYCSPIFNLSSLNHPLDLFWFFLQFFGIIKVNFLHFSSSYCQFKSRFYRPFVPILSHFSGFNLIPSKQFLFVKKFYQLWPFRRL